MAGKKKSRRRNASGATRDAKQATQRASGSGAESPDRKLAETVADRIGERIKDLGWPVGQVLGSESSLVDEYGVSRSVFREAIRLLESDRVVTTRRGPGGGIVVTEPDPTAVSRSVRLLLNYSSATVEQIHEARQALELFSTTKAAEEIDLAGITRLREVVAADRAPRKSEEQLFDFHLVIAEIAGNPVLRFFVEVLETLARDFVIVSAADRKSYFSSGRHEENCRVHEEIGEAIISQDAALARHLMNVHLQDVAELMCAGGSSRKR
jgi:DNA-binding FadR family transcriptional regulator